MRAPFALKVLISLVCIAAFSGSAIGGQPAGIKDLRHSSTTSFTRVVLELTYSTGFTVNSLKNPDRLYIDLKDSMVLPDVPRSVTVEDGILGSIRYGQFDSTTVRVVMEIEPGNTYKVFRLEGPPRVVVDFFRATQSHESIERPSGEMSSQTMILARKKLQELERRKAELKARIDAQKASENNVGSAQAVVVSSVISESSAEQARREQEEARAEEARREQAKAEQARKEQEEARAEEARQQAIAEEAARKDAEAKRAREEESRKLAEAHEKALARSSGYLAADSAPVVPKQPAANPSGQKSASRRPDRFKRHLIVVDAGHGGKDPGALGPRGLKEKDVVLDIAKRLKRKLEALGRYRVVLTRSGDSFLELEDRARIANRHDADIFVSIHANASHNKRARGLETYYLNINSDEDTIKIAARENAVPIEQMRQAIDTTKTDYLLASLKTQNKQYESADLAKKVREKMYSAVRSRYDGVTTKRSSMGPFYVLYGARMPAVLVEVSYMTNKTEASRLATSTYRDYLAGGIAEGLKDYLNSTMAAADLAKR